MNPADALPQDRRMYYHHCWMKHEKHGVGMVTADGGDMYLYVYPNGEVDGVPKPVKPKDLSCWWPRAGAYNTPTGAIYVHRKAIRTMRKSAYPQEHYVVRYGRNRNPTELMLTLRKGADHYSMEYALKVIKDGLSTGVAITRDIILAKGKFGEVLVIFRGMHAGEYRDGEFIPTFRGSPLAKRVMYKLAHEEMR